MRWRTANLRRKRRLEPVTLCWLYRQEADLWVREIYVPHNQRDDCALAIYCSRD
jgi:hypothetical protein